MTQQQQYASALYRYLYGPTSTDSVEVYKYQNAFDTSKPQKRDDLAPSKLRCKTLSEVNVRLHLIVKIYV